MIIFLLALLFIYCVAAYCIMIRIFAQDTIEEEDLLDKYFYGRVLLVILAPAGLPFLAYMVYKDIN